MFTIHTIYGSRSFDRPILLSEAFREMGIIHPQPCGGRGVCQKCRVIANGTPVLACRTLCEADTSVILPPETIRSIAGGILPDFPIDRDLPAGVGLAVDLGTTTVSGYLYTLPEGKLLQVRSLPNPQLSFGGDVISRMDAAVKGHLDTLRQAVLDGIKALGDGYSITQTVVVGNTAMLHLLEGLNPKELAVAPYTPSSLFGVWKDSTYLAPCISGFVGADTTAAILSSRMQKDKASLLLDLGTNGELVLRHQGKLFCCSAAAGPALEGGEISQGSYAVDGAISRVWLEDGGLHYSAINHAPPIGICGTGLLDAIACMLRMGVLDRSGYLAFPFPIGDSGISVTPEDVRKIQLAKSAIRAGLETLVAESGASWEEIERVYLAGGFGNDLTPATAAEIGLIPSSLAEKTVSLGNAAGMGAVMMLLSKACRKDAQMLSQSAETVNLADSSLFSDYFIHFMSF